MMRTRYQLLLLLVALLTLAQGAVVHAEGLPVFIPYRIDGPVHDPANGSYWYGPFNESCSLLDVNGDGIPDITAGRNWYEGPDFTRKHVDYFEGADKWHPVWGHTREIAFDVNKDGHMDVFSTGYQLTAARIWWLENPGQPDVKWKFHAMEPKGGIEGAIAVDMDGDGDDDILVNYFNPESADGLTWYESVDKEPWLVPHVIGKEGNDHGNGAGDINGDGRIDVVTRHGWWEAPEDRVQGTWSFHEDYELRYSASHPMLVFDVDEDGLNDMIVGNSHDYGLYWYQQKVDDDGNRTFVEHVIESDYGCFHTMTMGDVNQDGKLDLVTGKRLYAHDGNDRSARDPLFMFWYDIQKGKFVRHPIYFNNLQWYPNGRYTNLPPLMAIGTGMKIIVEEVYMNGKFDILVSGRGGLYLLVNDRYTPTPRSDHPRKPTIGQKRPEHKSYPYIPATEQ